MPKKMELGLLHGMQDYVIYEAVCLIALGLAISPLLMQYGVFTASVLTVLSFCTLGFLINIGIIPYQWIEDNPQIEWALLMLFPIGMALEHFKIFSLRPLSTLPLTTLPPYSTTTEAFITNPELIIVFVLIVLAVAGAIFKKKR